MRNAYKYSLCVTGIMIGLLIFSICEKTTYVINHGIVKYQNMFRCVLVLTILAFLVSIALVIISSVMKRRDAIIIASTDSTRSAKEAKRRLERKQSMLYEQLDDFARGKWIGIRSKLLAILQNLDKMNTYQENLEELLRRNNKPELADSMDIVQEIENSMYGNVRKAVNYLQVMDERDEDAVLETIKNYHKLNKELLKKAMDLILAITDFVNNDEDKDAEQRTLYLIESYRETILGENSLEDKYLN